MKHKQSGFAHIQVIIIGAVVLSVVAFAAYRVGELQTSNDQAKNETADAGLVDDITIKEETVDESKEITIPSEKDVATTQPVEKKPASENKKEPVEEKKKDKVWLEMKKITATQDGSVVNIVSRLPSKQSGTCHFKLWQDGQEKVYSSKTISSATDCVGQLDVSSLATYSGWELHVWFDGSDGKTHAHQKEASITLSNPNKLFSS